MAKIQLKTKKDKPMEVEKPTTIFTQDIQLYFSGFSLTDNVNFAEFYLTDLPEGTKEVRRFEFDEESLFYQIGDKPNIIIDDEKDIVIFNKFFLDKKYFLYFTNKYPQANFYWLKTFLKEPIQGLIGVLIGTKLVGLLKLKLKEKENENG